MRSQPLSMALAAGLLIFAAACQRDEPAPETAEVEEPAEVALAEEAAPLLAHAKLAPRAGGSANGLVSFSEQGGVVTVVADMGGVAPAGLHGFHIHEVGDCSAEDFKSAGGHFNPTGAPHGGPQDAERHAGDLGNIEIADSGAGRLEVTSDLITVADGPQTVIGRAVILHEGEDDLVSQPTGAAGSRLACGVVVEGPAGG